MNGAGNIQQHGSAGVACGARREDAAGNRARGQVLAGRQNSITIDLCRPRYADIGWAQYAGRGRMSVKVGECKADEQGLQPTMSVVSFVGFVSELCE